MMVARSKTEQFALRLNGLLDRAGAPEANKGRGRWFLQFLKQNNIEVSYEAARKWLAGESMPYTKRLGTIARSLNSSTEYLIGETDSEAGHTAAGPVEIDQAILTAAIKLTESVIEQQQLNPSDNVRAAVISHIYQVIAEDGGISEKDTQRLLHTLSVSRET